MSTNPLTHSLYSEDLETNENQSLNLNTDDNSGQIHPSGDSVFFKELDKIRDESKKVESQDQFDESISDYLDGEATSSALYYTTSYAKDPSGGILKSTTYYFDDHKFNKISHTDNDGVSTLISAGIFENNILTQIPNSETTQESINLKTNTEHHIKEELLSEDYNVNQNIFKDILQTAEQTEKDKNIWEEVEDVGEAALEGIKNTWQEIEEVFEADENILEEIEDVGEAALEGIQDIWDEIKDVGEDALEGIQDAWEEVKDVGEDAWEEVKDVGEDALEGIQYAWEEVKDVGEDALEGIQDAWEEVKDVGEDALEGIQDAWEAAGDRLEYFENTKEIQKISANQHAHTEVQHTQTTLKNEYLVQESENQDNEEQNKYKNKTSDDVNIYGDLNFINNNINSESEQNKYYSLGAILISIVSLVIVSFTAIIVSIDLLGSSKDQK